MFISIIWKEFIYEVINMKEEEIWNEVEKIFEVPHRGIVSTAYGNMPYSRYMLLYNDGENLYSKTRSETVKVEELEKNNLSYIILGYDAETKSSYLEILAETEIVMDQNMIDWLWKREDHQRFDLEDEEVLIVLKFKPRQIKLMNANDEIDQPEVIDLSE